MSGFVKKSLNKYKQTPTKPQHAPSKATPINYDAKAQAPTPDDDTPLLSPEGIRQVQDIVGTFAWYSRATDPTMTPTLSLITGRQSKATQQLCEEVTQFLDHCTTHPDAHIRFHASDMVLALHSDTSHLSEPGSKSRAVGHFYLTYKGTKDLDNGTIPFIQDHQTCHGIGR